MLCISVAPVSRKLAKADLLNAAGQCDLVELCLDHFLKEPDVGDMLQGIPKPILVACRRPQDGGRFNGTEEERMTLLRQAIVAGPEYVELDLDTAPKVPRFGKTKRLIRRLSLQGPPEDLDAVYDQAVEAKADAIKFAWPAPTFEAVWPLFKIIYSGGRFPSSVWRSAAVRTRWLCSAARWAPPGVTRHWSAGSNRFPANRPFGI